MLLFVALHQFAIDRLENLIHTTVFFSVFICLLVFVSQAICVHFRFHFFGDMKIVCGFYINYYLLVS